MDFNMPNGINCLKYQTESQTLTGKLCKFKNGKIKWMLEKKTISTDIRFVPHFNLTCKSWRNSLEVFLLYCPHTKLWLFSNKGFATFIYICLQRVFLVELLLVVGLSASELNSRHSTATQQSTFNSEQWNLFSFSFAFIGSIFIHGLQFMHCRVRDNQWSRRGENRNIPNSPKYRFMTFGCASLQSPLTTLTTIHLQK